MKSQGFLRTSSRHYGEYNGCLVPQHTGYPLIRAKLRIRPNPYSSVVSRTHMAEIQCPHCEEDIELENDIFGLFDCPHCGEEFSWDKMKEESLFDSGKSALRLIVKWGLYLSLAVFTLSVISFIPLVIIGDSWDGLLASLTMFMASGHILLISLILGVFAIFIGVYKDD